MLHRKKPLNDLKPAGKMKINTGDIITSRCCQFASGEYTPFVDLCMHLTLSNTGEVTPVSLLQPTWTTCYIKTKRGQNVQLPLP